MAQEEAASRKRSRKTPAAAAETAPSTMIPRYGVRKRSCRRLKAAGINPKLEEPFVLMASYCSSTS